MWTSWPYQLQVSQEPPLVEVVAVGAAVLVGITIVHGFALSFIVRRYRHQAKLLRQQVRHPYLAWAIFGWAIMLMLLSHLADATIWASIVRTLGLITDFRSAIYVSASNYTTLGIATVPFVGWRELSPIMAISGLFTFAWTTSVMFNMVGSNDNLIDELAEEYAKKMQMRSATHSEIRDVLEADQQKSEEAVKSQPAARSFLGRFKALVDEGMDRGLLSEQTRQQLEQIVEKERRAEQDIYQPPDPGPK